MKPILEAIVRLTNEFCHDHLNDEYAELCRKLAEKLSRKCPSPLLSGKPPTWASGIVRTIGWVNFLDDSTTTPHMKLTAIDKAFGVGESTGQGKSKTIRTMFRIRPFDPEWTLPGRTDDNPMVWMLEVNGFSMDVRRAPREVQEIAFEKGLIPYIPADRVDAEAMRTVPNKMSKPESLFTGRWRITSMEMWDQDFVDEEVPGYIEFKTEGLGDFQFGYVQCGIDWRKTDRDGKPAVEFSFEGMDEMTPTSGRGWAVLKDGRLNGKFYLHHGDESGFTATKPR